MNSATLKSIVLFLLNDVDVKTNENAIELFERWRKTTHYCVKDPLEVKWCLEYLNAMKSFNRDECMTKLMYLDYENLNKKSFS